MTRDQASGFVIPDFAIQEASEFAGLLFKRLMYYTCDAPERFLAEVTAALTACENQSLEDRPRVEATARVLLVGYRPPRNPDDIATRHGPCVTCEPRDQKAAEDAP